MLTFRHDWHQFMRFNFSKVGKELYSIHKADMVVILFGRLRKLVVDDLIKKREV